MKKLLLVVFFLIMVSGCANRPIVMKSNNKYFAPVRTTAMAISPSKKKTMRFVSLASAEKEIDSKNVTIELLQKENQRLRDRIAKLEKKLAITNS